jgi:hypothetical protein
MGAPTSASPTLTVAEMLSDPTTLKSLFLVVVLLSSAYLLSNRVLAKSTAARYRVLFVWHTFSSLTHFVFEGSFLYNCLFSWAPRADIHPAIVPENWLGHTDRSYGANWATNWAGALWRVYAQADARWGVADANVVSIELLTVLGAGPLAAYVAYLLAKGNGRVSFWMTVLAVGELYGGFMTFAPEWLTGSQNLDTSNWMYTWVYLFFFNTLWVWFPLYAMWVAYCDLVKGVEAREGAGKVKKSS